jgi:stage V sporulation protein SpoVS
VTPSFSVLQLEDGEKTAIKFFIKVEDIQWKKK